MPYDGSGNFNRTFPPGGWQGDAAGSIKIRADRHDQHDADLAQGLSNAICRDGQSQITANIPFNGKKIVNLGAPVNLTDAATKGYVDSIKTFSTGAIITGSDLNGRLSFTSPVGVNGISWTSGDLFWGVRPAVAGQSPNRIVLNDKADATGTDFINIDEVGIIGGPGGMSLTGNMFREGGVWRTPVAGRADLFQMSNGTIRFYTNATVTAAAHLTPALVEYFSVVATDGSATMTLNKTGSAKNCDLWGRSASAARWLVRLGDDGLETGSNEGSDFRIYAYNDAGTTPSQAMAIDRSTLTTTFNGPVTGNSSITATGGIVSSQNYSSSTAALVLGTTGAGSIYLRPNGLGSTTGEFQANSSGDVVVSGRTYGGTGYIPRTGISGGYGTNPFNFWWTSPQLQAYVDTSNLGNILNTCDYRVKKDVVPLESKWDVVKALSPVSYTHAEFTAEGSETPLYLADDIQRWGFIAHEVQETLLPTAADGEKDAPNQIQNLNLVAVVAALTKALQEAMARIEALEAAA